MKDKKKFQEVQERMAAARRLEAEALLETSDDWYPNVAGNKVRVRLLALINQKTGNPDNWRVLVKGDDDTAMEIDLPHHGEARHLFDSIKVPVTRTWLASVGFRQG